MTEDTNGGGKLVTLNVAGLGQQGEDISTAEADAAIQADHPSAATLQGAQAKLAVETSEILTQYHDRISEIRDRTSLEDGPYNDRLSDQAKAEILATKKQEAADALYKETRERYEAAFDSFSGEAAKHADDLRTALFGLGESGSAALSQAIAADEPRLLEMVRLGELTNVTTLSRAALAAAITRGDAPAVIHDYIQRFPQDEPLLRAYQSAPDEAWVEERKARIDNLLKPATSDQLASRPSIRPY